MKLDPADEKRLQINTVLIVVGSVCALFGLYCVICAAVGIATHQLPTGKLADCVLYVGFLVAGSGLSFWKITERIVMLREIKEQAVLDHNAKSPDLDSSPPGDKRKAE